LSNITKIHPTLLYFIYVFYAFVVYSPLPLTTTPSVYVSFNNINNLISLITFLMLNGLLLTLARYFFILPVKSRLSPVKIGLYAPILIIILLVVGLIIAKIMGDEMTTFVAPNSPLSLFLSLLVCLLVGYNEELFFRVIPASASNFTLKSPFCWLSLLLFALAHNKAGLAAIINGFVLGFILILTYYRCRSVALNSVTHALYNFLALFIAYINS
jgi:membrane protease YdiL (CAAX protease family)